MDPKLSSELVLGLKRMGNSTLVNDEMFMKLLDCGVSTITQTELLSADFCSKSFGSSKGDIIKEAHCALLSLFVEAVRSDLSSESLLNFLDTQVNWPKSRCDKLCDVYAQVLPKIRAQLSTVGSNPPHIVDVEWRLNYNIKSSSNEHLCSSVVLVQLNTEGTGNDNGNEKINFSCTLPELQDLVSKLKEALRQVEHVAQLNQ